MSELADISLSYLPMYICSEYSEYLPSQDCSFDLGVYNMETPYKLIRTVVVRLHEA